MNRFWLLLLACILSVQTSWAAVHFCDEAAPLARAAAAQDHAGALGALHDADDATGGIHGDQCCSAAHGGHVLQSLMSQEPHALAVGSVHAAPAEPRQPRKRERFPERVERPQWSAA